MSRSVPSTGLLSVYLDAIADNWELLHQRMHSSGGNQGCAAVVKADAYGLGIKPVAMALWQAGCRVYFVATLNEAIELRQCLNDHAQIIVLGGICHGLGEEWQRYSLVPVLLDTSHITAWMSRFKESPCAIKVDTGMHRLGLSPQEYEAALPNLKGMNVSLVMSHLACADVPEHPLNVHQQRVFANIASITRQHLSRAKLSFANSSGLFLGEQFYFDVGRPGAALYGVNPNSSFSNPMKPVVRLQLPIMQVKTIPAGDCAGYGAGFVATRETRLAVVFGGYADGLLRALSHSGCVLLNGYKAPIVGRVSMDSLIVDVTDAPDAAIENGWVDIIGADQSIDALAQAAGTIGYEILTSFGKRYQRRYLSNDIEVESE